jgi:hypothetical protein
VYGTPRGHILGGPICPGLHSEGDMEVGAEVASTPTSHEARHEIGDVGVCFFQLGKTDDD